jgi:hypothetical protein
MQARLSSGCPLVEQKQGVSDLRDTFHHRGSISKRSCGSHVSPDSAKLARSNWFSRGSSLGRSAVKPFGRDGAASDLAIAGLTSNRNEYS